MNACKDMIKSPQACFDIEEINIGASSDFKICCRAVANISTKVYFYRLLEV